MRSCLIPLMCFWFGFFTTSSSGIQHNVGDKAGWKAPSFAKINYTEWAALYTYKVEDTLHFKYDKGVDSVLQVRPADFESCSNSTPVASYDDGDTMVYLLREGWYHFICGNLAHCSSGQKFSLHVLPYYQQQYSLPSASSSTAAAAAPVVADHPGSSSSSISPSTSSCSSSNGGVLAAAAAASAVVALLVAAF